MPYQGNTPVESYIATVKDSFNGNGSTTAFTMSKPTQVNDVRVVVENVIQDPSVAYTVSGTTITFTSAPPSGTNNIYVIHLGPAVATAQPPAEIADATTFASNVSVQGAFTSPGIDDNADATAITIDSSEVVLVGKTSNTFSQQGVALRANNDSQITRDGGNPLSLNRTSSDGDIAKFFRDGSEVGSIGKVGTGFEFNSSSIYTHFTNNNNTNSSSNITWIQGNTNPWATNYYDLGNATYKWKDAYIGGGIYLGGNGSANKLEDYEEGTWTPNPTFGGQSTGMSFTTRTGGYTKVGRFVYVSGRIVFSNKGSSTGYFQIYGLPFTASNLGEGFYGGGFLVYAGNLANPTSWEATQYPVVDTNNSYIYMRYANSSGGSNNHSNSDINNNSDLLFQAFYTTDA